MAIVPMTNAVPGTVALAAEYNKLITNILDLDTRTTAVEAAVGGGTGEVPRKGGEWMWPATGTTVQNIGPGATLVNLWIPRGTPSGVTYSAGTWTVTEAGLYSMTANVRFGGASTNRYVMITDQNGFNIFKNSAPTTLNLNCGGVIRVGAGAQFRVYAYSDVANTILKESGNDLLPNFHIYKVGN